MLINGRFLTQRTTGVQRFAREILSAASNLKLLAASHDKILMPRHATTETAFAGISTQTVGKLQGHGWEQMELACYARDSMLLNLCNTAPILRHEQLVVLHDAAVAAMPENFSWAFRAWYQVMIRSYGQRAKIIATVSKFSAREITQHFGIPLRKIEIIPESGEHILRNLADSDILVRHNLEPDRYFLAVGSHAPNKNFANVVKAIQSLSSTPFTFVIVGGRNNKIFHAENSALTHAVEVGFVTDNELRALYENAACFIYPSLYEGFGIPPLEAMACGCPTLVSNTTSLPEVCGDAAHYCDPHSPHDIAKKLTHILDNATLRHEMRAAGRTHSSTWTWEKAARQLADIIKAH